MKGPIWFVLLLSIAFHALAAEALDERHPRPMARKDFAIANLSVVVENQPAWEVTLDETSEWPTVRVESPPNYYPPAIMEFVNLPGQRLPGNRTKAQTLARDILATFAQTYAGHPVSLTNDQLLSQRYDLLEGYETVISKLQNGSFDMRLFIGQASDAIAADNRGGTEDDGMIVMVLMAPVGTLPALRHVVRRSWTNTYFHIAN